MRRLTRVFGRVVMYHRVVRDDCDPVLRSLFPGAITCGAFDRQLDYLARHYHVVDLDTLIANIDRPRGMLAVTFDDGYADNLHHALPRLKARGLPATVFAVSGLIGTSRGNWRDRLARKIVANGRRTLTLDTGSSVHEFPYRGSLHRQMRQARDWLQGRADESIDALLGDRYRSDEDRFLDVDELRLLDKDNIRIGAHTVGHVRLSELSESAALTELRRCRSMLESMLGRAPHYLAYHFGRKDDFGVAAQNAAQRAGFRAAFAAFGGLIHADTDRFAIPRIATHQDISHFRLKIARKRVP